METDRCLACSAKGGEGEFHQIFDAGFQRLIREVELRVMQRRTILPGSEFHVNSRISLQIVGEILRRHRGFGKLGISGFSESPADHLPGQLGGFGPVQGDRIAEVIVDVDGHAVGAGDGFDDFTETGFENRVIVRIKGAGGSFEHHFVRDHIGDVAAGDPADTEHGGVLRIDPARYDALEFDDHRTGRQHRIDRLVRAAAVEAGGLVAVIRNPVKASFLQKNSAVGGLSLAIETGRRYSQGLEKSVENGVQEVCEFLGGEILAHGPVEEYQLRSEGGFDVGVVKIGGYEMSFWNEYMTVDGPDGQRRGTFPDLIMTFDSQTGRPTPTSDLKQGQEVYLIHVGYQHLKLAAPMFDKDLLAGVEKIINRPIVDCVSF